MKYKMRFILIQLKKNIYCFVLRYLFFSGVLGETKKDNKLQITYKNIQKQL